MTRFAFVSFCLLVSTALPALQYLTVMGAHAVLTLWRPHAEQTLVAGTVHHSG